MYNKELPNESYEGERSHVLELESEDYTYLDNEERKIIALEVMRAYILAERLLAHGLRRRLNNILPDFYYLFHGGLPMDNQFFPYMHAKRTFKTLPREFLTEAFDNIPANRPILYLLASLFIQKAPVFPESNKTGAWSPMEKTGLTILNTKSRHGAFAISRTITKT